MRRLYIGMNLKKDKVWGWCIKTRLVLVYENNEEPRSPKRTYLTQDVNMGIFNYRLFLVIMGVLRFKQLFGVFVCIDVIANLS